MRCMSLLRRASSALGVMPLEDEQIVEPKLESLRNHELKTMLGEYPGRFLRPESVVLVMGDAIENPKPLTEMDHPIDSW